MSETHKSEEHYRKIVAKAWSDDNFRQRLIAEPKTVLGQEGVHLPTGFDVKIQQESAVVPSLPQDEVLLC